MADGERAECSSTSGGRRKHVVNVVYAILAVLMGASLFLVVGPAPLAARHADEVDAAPRSSKNRSSGPNSACARTRRTRTSWSP